MRLIFDSGHLPQRILLLLAISAGSVLPAKADGRIDCASMPSLILHRAVRYCVEIPSGYDAAKSRRYPVLYFLHGLGDDEQTLFKTGGWTLIEDLRQRHRIGEFLIAAPDGGRTFFINSADGKVRYSDFFVKEFVPAIEKKYRVVPGRAGRGISGVSMGGYGALRFAFAYPEMFSSVSAQSAALILDSPKALDGAAGSGSPIMQTIGAVFGNPVNVTHWEANSPFTLARRNAARLRRIAIYFNCGQSDDYGFEKGAAKLDRELSEEHIPHEYHPYPGDHSLNYFLLHFPEILEFHSRAFTTRE
jgi:S-formylglutathione hydrolase FrmB